MPIYEYRCKKGHEFETLQTFSDDPVSVCAVCGATVERVYRPIAVHFKGSGFYNTDYGTKKRSREMKEAKEGKEGVKAEGGGKDAAKSDSGSSSSSSSSDSSGSSGSSGSESKPAASESGAKNAKKADSTAKSK